MHYRCRATLRPFTQAWRSQSTDRRRDVTLRDSEHETCIAQEGDGGEVAPQDARTSFRIRGAVENADGTPWVGGVVRAYDVDLRSEQLLQSTKTDEHGRYEVSYTAAMF